MRNKNDWVKTVPIENELTPDLSALKLSVKSKIENQKGAKITMTKRRKYKSLIIAAAVISTMTVSMISVNAATDGAITKTLDKTVEKVMFIINGEETEREAEVTHNSDGSVEYKFDVDENSDKQAEFTLTEVAGADSNM